MQLGENQIVKEELHYKRNFSLLLGNQFLIRCAESIFFLSIIWYLYDLTGSALATSFYTIISIFSSVILGPFIGVVADRNNPKKLMQISFIGITLIGIILAVLFYFDIAMLLVFIYLFTLLHSTFNMVSGTSKNRLIGTIFPISKIPSANGYLTSSSAIADTFGNAVAGFVLLALGYAGIILFHSSIYLIASLLLMLVVMNEKEEKDINKNNVGKKYFFKDLKEGIKEFRSNKPLFKIIIIGSMINFLTIGSALIVVLMNEHFHVGAREYGIFHAAGTLASIVVGLLAGKILKPVRPGILFVGCLLLVGFGMICISLTTNFWIGTILFMVMAASEILMMVSIHTMLITLVEEQFRGRVYSLSMGLSSLFMPVGIVFNSYIADFFDIKYVYLIVGCWGIFWALIGLLDRDIRGLKSFVKEA